MSISLSRIVLVSADPETLARFYKDAFGFIDSGCFEPPFMGIRHSEIGLRLRLKRQVIDIMAFEQAGLPYPSGISGLSPLFQHFAIVVSGMDKAYERLNAQPGWAPISCDGPEQLPAASGGVKAFKFRDPEGHPLELIEFKAGFAPSEWQSQPMEDIFLGIDHSAVSVADSARSIGFYKEFGLTVGNGSLNTGIEQGKLDAIPDAIVEVTGLSLPEEIPPHVELLRYRQPASLPPRPAQAVNDIAATQLVFSIHDSETFARLCARHRNALIFESSSQGGGSERVLLRDPDNHLIRLERV